MRPESRSPARGACRGGAWNASQAIGSSFRDKLGAVSAQRIFVDGLEAGLVVDDGRRFEALKPSGASLGMFNTAPAAARAKLPNPRRSTVFDFDDAGILYRAQVYLGADGRPLEIFIDGPKVGSTAQIAAHDAAVAASLALQHGCSAEVLGHALLKLADGSSAGPIGKLFDMLAAGHAR